ncbi:MAG: SWIM zinc finger family protein [Coleofasciculaceae cyanobacterium]
MTDYEIESQEWWVQRWTDLLNSYRFKKRLERGRKYAKEGNILSIDFQGAQVKAKVQGSVPEPYELSISIDPFTEEDWGYVVETMAKKAIYSAQLLAGEMPHNIEEVFTANGLSLFPFTLPEVHSQCSCPDPQNPCKHIAAVYYQLGDRFSEDPFVLFQLRGRTKEQILDKLRQLRSQKDEETGEVKEESKKKKGKKQKTESQESETKINLEKFWQYFEPLDPSLVVITPPAEERTVLDVLGKIPLATADENVVQYLKEAYQTISQKAMMSALNQDE